MSLNTFDIPERPAMVFHGGAPAGKMRLLCATVKAELHRAYGIGDGDEVEVRISTLS